MASTTDNFNLDLYDAGDPAALTDQYNSAMHIIDDTLLTINGNAGNALKGSTEIKSWLGNLGITDADTATTAKNHWDGAATQAANATNNLNALGITNTDTAETSKNRWNDAATSAATNKSDIATINANLNALHANSVEDATKLYNQIQAGTENIAVIIGDSFSATDWVSTTGAWWEKFAP